MYGSVYGSAYDLGSAYDINGLAMGEMDMGDMEMGDASLMDNVKGALQKKVFGVPAWLIGLGALGALVYTGKIKLGGKTAKRNPRRKSRKHNRRKSRR